MPVILLTARGEESDRILGLELGADDLRGQALFAPRLAVRVGAVLRRTRQSGEDGDRSAVLNELRAAGAPGSVLDIGGFQIDLATREAIRGGAVVPLTATEFDLLWCLASHPRVVFSGLSCWPTSGATRPPSMPGPARSLSTSGGCGKRSRTTPPRPV